MAALICKQYRPGNGQLIIIQHIKLRSNIFYMTKNLFVANRVMYPNNSINLFQNYASVHTVFCLQDIIKRA